MGITVCGALDTDQPLPLVMVAERAGSQSLQVGGGPLLPTTDHYAARDLDALAAALDMEVAGDREAGSMSSPWSMPSKPSSGVATRTEPASPFPRSRSAAKFSVSSFGTRWTCGDSLSPLQPGLECPGQPLQHGGLRQR